MAGLVDFGHAWLFGLTSNTGIGSATMSTGSGSSGKLNGQSPAANENLKLQQQGMSAGNKRAA